MRKYFIAPVLAAALFAGAFSVQAAGLTEAQIQSIMSLLFAFGTDASVVSNVETSLRGGTPSSGSNNPSSGNFCHTFNTDIELVWNDASHTTVTTDVLALVQALQLQGYTIDLMGAELGTPANKWLVGSGITAIKQFQTKYGINPTGYVGPLTRAKLNQFYSCTTTGVSSAVSINSISPTSGAVGRDVTLTGSGFGAASMIDVLYSKEVSIHITSVSSTQLKFSVPKELSPGSYQLRIVGGSAQTHGTLPTSNYVSFTVTGGGY